MDEHQGNSGAGAGNNSGNSNAFGEHFISFGIYITYIQDVCSFLGYQAISQWQASILLYSVIFFSGRVANLAAQTFFHLPYIAYFFTYHDLQTFSSAIKLELAGAGNNSDNSNAFGEHLISLGIYIG